MYSRLVPHLVFPAYERLSGRRPWTAARRLRELQWRTPEELEARAMARLRPLLAHAAAHVPHYRELFAAAGLRPADIRTPADLARLPITTKADLRAGFPTRAVADNLPARRRWAMSTSGSSGLPFAFYADRAGWDDWMAARLLLFQEWAGAAVWDATVRIIDPDDFEPGVADAPRLARLARRVLLGERRLRLSGQDLTAARFRAIAARLAGGRRYYIWGYPSYVARLAGQLLEAGGALPARPSVVISGGETLTPIDEATIGRAFGCRVVNHYSCWEVPHMALSCPDNPPLLHVNSQRVILRTVRPDGTDAAAGEPGRVVLTHLTNYVMPFINYDLGDRAVAGGACPCGRGLPTLRQVEGRVVESIRTPAGRTVTTSALTGLLMRRHPIIDQVWQYQAEQTAVDAVVLRVVPTARFSPAFARQLRGRVEDFLGPGMRVEIETVDRIPRERSGKRLVIRPGPAPGEPGA